MHFWRYFIINSKKYLKIVLIVVLFIVHYREQELTYSFIKQDYWRLV